MSEPSHNQLTVLLSFLVCGGGRTWGRDNLLYVCTDVGKAFFRDNPARCVDNSCKCHSVEKDPFVFQESFVSYQSHDGFVWHVLNVPGRQGKQVGL